METIEKIFDELFNIQKNKIEIYKKYSINLVNITNNELIFNPFELINSNNVNSIYITQFILKIDDDIKDKIIYVYIKDWINIANNIHKYTFVKQNDNSNELFYFNKTHIPDAINNNFEKISNFEISIYYINKDNDRIEIQPTKLFIEFYFDKI